MGDWLNQMNKEPTSALAEVGTELGNLLNYYSCWQGMVGELFVLSPSLFGVLTLTPRTFLHICGNKPLCFNISHVAIWNNL